jgi:hypothetical protein
MVVVVVAIQNDLIQKLKKEATLTNRYHQWLPDPD